MEGNGGRRKKIGERVSPFEPCADQAGDPRPTARVPQTTARMPIRVRTSGCLFSIIASLLLTLLLNLALRACS